MCGTGSVRFGTGVEDGSDDVDEWSERDGQYHSVTDCGGAAGGGDWGVGGDDGVCVGWAGGEALSRE